jgi:putative peptidoglycan lipid II flippase
VNIAGTIALVVFFRRRLGHVDGRAIVKSYLRIALAAGAAAAVAGSVWLGLDLLVGRSLGAQLVSVGGAIVLAGLVYFGFAYLLRVRELQTLLSLVRRSGTTA